MNICKQKQKEQKPGSHIQRAPTGWPGKSLIIDNQQQDIQQKTIESVESSRSDEIIVVGSNVKWTNNKGETLTGEVIEFTKKRDKCKLMIIDRKSGEIQHKILEICL